MVMILQLCNFLVIMVLVILVMLVVVRVLVRIALERGVVTRVIRAQPSFKPLMLLLILVEPSRTSTAVLVSVKSMMVCWVLYLGSCPQQS